MKGKVTISPGVYLNYDITMKIHCVTFKIQSGGSLRGVVYGRPTVTVDLLNKMNKYFTHDLRKELISTFAKSIDQGQPTHFVPDLFVFGQFSALLMPSLPNDSIKETKCYVML